MGRAKRRLELLSNEKERLRTFERRSKGLKKQLHELKTLCDIDVCLIVDNAPKGELQIWPPDRDQINKLIKCYKNQTAHDFPTESNLSTFFEAQNQKLEKEIMELKKIDENNKYPMLDNGYNMLSREQLEEFGGLLGQKLQYLTTTMEAMRNSSHMSSFQNGIAAQNELYYSSPISFMKPEVRNSCDSSQTQVYLQNSMTNMPSESDLCFTQLEDLYSTNFMNFDNFDKFGIPDDFKTQVIPQCFDNAKFDYEYFGESLPVNSDEYFEDWIN